MPRTEFNFDKEEPEPLSSKHAPGKDIKLSEENFDYENKNYERISQRKHVINSKRTNSPMGKYRNIYSKQRYKSRLAKGRRLRKRRKTRRRRRRRRRQKRRKQGRNVVLDLSDDDGKPVPKNKPAAEQKFLKR